MILKNVPPTIKTDPDYRDNQSRSHKDWTKDNPEYWRQYREAHPDYTERNRQQPQKRNQKQLATEVDDVIGRS